jgi:hypothetical protein
VGKELIASQQVTKNTYLEYEIVKVATGSPVPTPTGDYTTVTFIATIAGLDLYLMSKETVEYV